MLFSTKLRPLFGSKHLHSPPALVFVVDVCVVLVVVLVVDVVVVNISMGVDEVVWTRVVVDFVVWH